MPRQHEQWAKYRERFRLQDRDCAWIAVFGTGEAPRDETMVPVEQALELAARNGVYPADQGEPRFVLVQESDPWTIIEGPLSGEEAERNGGGVVVELPVVDLWDGDPAGGFWIESRRGDWAVVDYTDPSSGGTPNWGIVHFAGELSRPYKEE